MKKNTSEYWPIEKLKKWDKNPRGIKKERFEELKVRLSKHGLVKPLLVKPDGTVVGGNMRLEALKELGATEVWVSVVEPLDDKEMFELALTDNEEFGYYEKQQLAELAVNLGLERIELKQFEIHLGKPRSLDSILSELGPDAEEDEAPELGKGDPISKLGEVYELGRHRIMCGDSTNQDQVKLLLGGKPVKMIFTDPPYGVDYSSRVDEERRKGWGGIQNDNLEGADLQNFLSDVLARHINTMPVYICCNWQSVSDFFESFGLPNSLIVWDKESIGLGSGYRNQHEFILFYGKLDHNSETNVWGIKRDSTGSYTHPTQKPVAVPSRAIRNSSADNDIVLDLFLGSGSTLSAAEQLNRICYGMELDPKYIDVCRRRYWKLVSGNEEGWEIATPAINVQSGIS